MMQAVLMSMKQKWWDKILSLEKDLEIRKNAPTTRKRKFTWPLTVLVYVSGTGAIQGQFTCNGYIKTNVLAGLHERACLSMEEITDYAGGPGNSVCAWTVSDPEQYDTPSPLAELGLTRPPVSWQYVDIPDRKEQKQ